MSNKSRRLLDESCAWIRDHWNASNLEVPDGFLARWTYEFGSEEAKPLGFHLAVFTFGYLQNDFIVRNVPPGVQQSVPATLLLELFQMWQLKLALAEVHHRTNLRVKPLPLFAFPADEKVETWFDAKVPSPDTAAN